MPAASRILVVDDEEQIRSLLRELLRANGFAVETAEDKRGAVLLLRTQEFEAVLTDLMLPDGDGLEVLRAARARPYDPEVLVITAYGTIDSAVEAVRLGAFDYLTKPIATQKLLVAVERAVERRTLRHEVHNLRREVAERYSEGGLIAASPGMRRIFELVDTVAATDCAVLIQGESGTGKELVARAIHFRGARAARPFVAVNCAALPEALLESELFGYAKGAFTGAAGERKGLFEEADGGSLLLDEIGDMPVLMQAKLLRVLQEGEIRRVGSAAVKRIDVRIIAATNRDVATLIREGRFRDDLYYRLNVIPLVIPPLRERRDDIVPLCEHFLALHGAKLGRQGQSLSPRALEMMLAHDWPGNVRELENMIARAATLSPSPVISEEELRTLFSLGGLRRQEPEPSAARDTAPAPGAPGGMMQSAERQTILRALREAQGNQTRAAQALGMGRNTLWRKMKKHGIDPA
jgi:DNA-binding NtrC family response regulator